MQTLQLELNSTVTLPFGATLDFWERGIKKKDPSRFLNLPIQSSYGVMENLRICEGTVKEV